MSELAVGSIAGLASNGFVVDVASGSQLTQPGMVLQVMQTVKTDPFAVTSSSFQPVTGMSATITPSSVSSKILVIVSASVFRTNELNAASFLRLTGGNSGDYIGDSNSSSTRAAASLFCFEANAGESTDSVNITYLDSPATTSEITYGLEISATAGATGLNRRNTDNGISAAPRTASSITVIEVGA